MRLLEKILAIGVLISLILKFNLIQGGEVSLMWSTMILTIIYYPFGFLFFNQIRLRDIFKRVAYKNVTAFTIILSIITGIGLSTTCIGSLFKLFHFSGANEMLTVGLITILIVSLVAVVFFMRQNKLNSKFLLIRTGIVGGFGIVLLFLTEMDLVKIQFRNHPAYIKTYTEYLKNPNDEESLRKKELEYYRIILPEDEFKKYVEDGTGNE
jgi:hypothetical protein